MQRQPRILVGRLRSLIDTIRGSYWFLPMLMATVAVVAAVVMVDLDRGLSSSAIERIPWIAKTEPEGTRGVLSVIAGSMITVTGVVFSITIVALTLASSQFGPRLLRNFLRDRANQLAFGTFVGTFLYALIVLRSVRVENVPLVASAVAVLLAAASVFVLIFFIHHIAVGLQATSIIASVAREIDAQLPSIFPEMLGHPEGAVDEDSITDAKERVLDDGVDVFCNADGFIRVLDDQAILHLAQRADITIVLHHRPGDFVYRGSALARVGPPDRVTSETCDTLRDAFIVGEHRTAVQDLTFLTSQLTEIASRALSPGVNNPHTAIDCIHRLGAVVCAAANRRMPSRGRFDDEGQLRVIAPAADFADLLANCFDEVRRYGASQVNVAIAMLSALRRAGECCESAARRAQMAEHARRVVEDFSRSDRAAAAHDRQEVERALAETLRCLEQPELALR